MELLSKLLSSQLDGYDPSTMQLWLKQEAKISALENGTIFEGIQAGILAPILNSLVDAVLFTDLNGKVKVVNKMAVHLFGGDFQDIGAQWRSRIKLYHSDTITPYVCSEFPLQRALRGEEVSGMEAFLKSATHPEGIFVEISAQPIRDNSNKIYGAVSSIRDISAQKRAEEELRESKARFEAIAHIANDFIWKWDLAKKTLCWRQGPSKPFGYENVQTNSANDWWQDKVHPEDAKVLERTWDDFLAGKIPLLRTEFRFRKANGQYAYVLGKAHIVERDSEGIPIQVMGAAIDISERRASEEKLLQIATLVESTDDAIISSDLDGKILSWNLGAEKMLGYAAKEMVGETGGKIVEKFEELHALVTAKISKGESIKRFEVWCKKKNGEIMLQSLTISPIRNSLGEIIGSCTIVRDITEVRQAEEKIKSLAQNLARSNEELKQFAYVASHDLREPLRTIASFAKLLDKNYKQKLPARALEYIKYMTDGAERMKHLIDSLLNYSRAEHSALSPQEIQCESLVGQVLEDLKFSIEESNAELIVHPLPKIRADEIQVRQLFQNLISNAVKFRKSSPPRVTISAEAREREWIFSVEDTGVGIEPRDQNRIFQIFQRLHNPREFSGTGLGLATCKKIIDRHGGKIWFTSTPGKGTVFCFSLPRLQASAPGRFPVRDKANTALSDRTF